MTERIPTYIPPKKPRWIPPYWDKFCYYVEKEGECEVWVGDIIEGRPRFNYYKPDGTRVNRAMAGRVAWEHHFGEIPQSNSVATSCGNALCVKKEHLVLQSSHEVALKGHRTRRAQRAN